MLSRRLFVEWFGQVIGMAMVGACGGSEKKGPRLDCSSSAGLTDAKAKTRVALNYVDMSKEFGKTCLNCHLYKNPEKAGMCGGCSVVAGPINPEGYCSAWIKASK